MDSKDKEFDELYRIFVASSEGFGRSINDLIHGLIIGRTNNSRCATALFGSFNEEDLSILILQVIEVILTTINEDVAKKSIIFSNKETLKEYICSYIDEVYKNIFKKDFLGDNAGIVHINVKELLKQYRESDDSKS